MFIQVPIPSEGARGEEGGEIENHLEGRETGMLERGKWPEPGGAVAFLLKIHRTGCYETLTILEVGKLRLREAK